MQRGQSMDVATAHRSRDLAPEWRKGTGTQRRARQLMSDDTLGESSRLDEGFKIDAGANTCLLAHQHQFLGRDIAWSAGLAREWAAAESSDRRIEARHPESHGFEGVGDGEAAGVVEMQTQLKFWPAVAHLDDQAGDPHRRCPPHGV